MDYFNVLLFPLDKNKLYHTYVGKIANLKHINMPNLPSTYDDANVVMHYQEILAKDDTLIGYDIKTIHLIPTIPKEQDLSIYCLSCGHELPLNQFNQCFGYLHQYTSYDYDMYEDRTHVNCSECSYAISYTKNNKSIPYKCQQVTYTCPYCFTKRYIKRNYI